MGSRQNGFAVLITVIILSVAAISYTSNMAYLQIMDNLVLGNYYRNSEAFVNAESGINLTLSKLNTVDTANEMLDNLPFVYDTPINSKTSYKVTVTKVASNKLHITSTGRSQDGTASRIVSLQAYYNIAFNIPIAPLSSNGTLQINATDSINDGCGGLTKAACRSPGNIAEKIIINNPNLAAASIESSNIEESPILCNSALSAANNIDENAIFGEQMDQQGHSRFEEVSAQQWGVAASAAGSVFDQVNTIDDMDNASSLFESTFGVVWQDAKEELVSSASVAHIDMNNLITGSCSDQLQSIDDDIDVIYIQGDCNIKQADITTSNIDGNQHFTLGSSDDPKMVFIEGGTFITPENARSTVIGMLYFMPASHDVIDDNGNLVYVDGIKQTLQEQSIDLAGIRVNGALLSEYNCSASNPMKSGNDAQKNLSIRYDKNVLNKLYKQLGMTDSTSNYQIVAGSWRDF